MKDLDKELSKLKLDSIEVPDNMEDLLRNKLMNINFNKDGEMDKALDIPEN